MTKPIIELRAAVRAAVDDAIQDALFVSGYLQTCLNCTKFDEQKELCVAANARPPARVIAFGCESFEECEEQPEPEKPATLARTPVVKHGGSFDNWGDDIPF